MGDMLKVRWVATTKRCWITVSREYIRVCHVSVTDVPNKRFNLKDSGVLIFQINANLLKFALPGDTVHKVWNQLCETPNEINIDSAFNSSNVVFAFISDSEKVKNHSLKEQ